MVREVVYSEHYPLNKIATQQWIQRGSLAWLPPSVISFTITGFTTTWMSVKTVNQHRYIIFPLSNFTDLSILHQIHTHSNTILCNTIMSSGGCGVTGWGGGLQALPVRAELFWERPHVPWVAAHQDCEWWTCLLFCSQVCSHAGPHPIPNAWRSGKQPAEPCWNRPDPKAIQVSPIYSSLHLSSVVTYSIFVLGSFLSVFSICCNVLVPFLVIVYMVMCH